MTKRAQPETILALKFAESDIQFSDIFDLVEVQELQDLFSDANSVASLITTTDGTPITIASNFCALCNIVRKTKKGAEKCALSDAALCYSSSNRPVVKKCLSAGLWDASAPISIGGKHIANWHIGQVRNDDIDENEVIRFANEIGVNEADFVKALNDVPILSTEKFKKIAEMLFAFANQLSEKAYKNLQLKIEIAERTLAEKALFESEDNYKTIFNSANEAVFIHDAETGKIIDVNDAALIVYGYSTKESILACNIGDLSSNTAPYTQDFAIEYLRKTIIDGPQTFEWMARRKDGTLFWVEISLKRTLIGGKERVLVAGRDVSLWKKTQKALIKSEERSRLLLESVNEGILVGQDGFLKYFNPFIISFTGYSEEELRKIPFLDLIYVDDRELLSRNYQRRINGEDLAQRYQLRIITKGEILKWIELSGVKFEWEGRPATLNFITDVTERKAAEKSLSESEEKYSKAFQIAPYGIVILNPQSGQILEVNDSFCATVGYSNEEILSDVSIGQKIWVKCEDKQSIIDNSLNGISVTNYEIQLIQRSGQIIIASTSAQVIRIHEINCILLTINDITQQKLDEYEIRTKSEELNYLNGRFSSALEKIKISNNELSNINDELEAKRAALATEKIFTEAILEGIPGFFYVYNDENKIVKWNKNHETMTGYSGYDIANMALEDWYDEDELIKVREALKVVADVGYGEMESQLKRNDGTKIFVRIKAVKVIQDNRTYILGVGIDITAWKNAELKLTESEARYRSIVTASPDDITITDLEGRILMVSPSALSLFSSKSENELIGQYIADYIAPEDWERATDNIGLLLQGVSVKVSEYRCLRPDGTSFYIEVNGEFIRNPEGNPVQMLFVVRDVTERRLANEALQASNEKYRLLLENSGIGVGLFSLEGEILLFNQKALENIGGVPSDYVGKSLIDVFGHDAAEIYMKRFKDVIKSDVALEYEDLAPMASGNKWFHSTHTKVVGGRGEIIGVQVLAHDITQRKQFEEKILQIGKFYQAIIEKAPDGIALVDARGEFLFASPAARKMFGFDKFENTLFSPNEFTHPDDIEMVLTHLGKLHLDPTYTPILQYRFRNKHGEYIWIESTFTNLLLDPAIAAIVINFRDISERKEAEDKLNRQNALLNTLIQNLTIGVFMVEVPSGKPLLANNVALELLGRGILPDVTKENIAEVYDAFKVDTHEHYPPDEMPILRGMKGEVSHIADMEVLRPDGTKKLLEIFGSPVKDEIGNIWASLVSFFDITERKQTEDAILNAMAFQQGLLDAIPSPVFYKDLNGRYIGANKAFEEYVGLSQSEFIGKTVFDIAPRDLAEKYDKTDIELFAKMGTQTYEAPIVFADGTLHDVIFSKAIFKNSDNQVAGLIGIIVDISERKSLEKAILHSSRLYALLSHINQAIVHSKNQDELFKTICDVAIEIGHFRMAWIGLIDSDNNLKPVSFAGHNDGYLSDIAINTIDPYLGQGPCGLAFQTRSVVAVHNIAQDECMSPWRVQALAQGYQSSAAVPFCCRNQIIGIFTLYASEIGFFNEEEQKLLQEIGDDISFALDSMANDVERTQAQEELKLYNSRLELAMYSANMAWWEMDMTTGLVVFEKRKAEMLGYSPDKFHHYKDFMALVHPDDAEPIMENMRQHLYGNFDKYEVEYRILASTGEYKWFYDIGSIISRNVEGKPYKVTGLVIDISERKRAEIALFQNEEMLRESQMIAGLGGYVLDFVTSNWKGSETLDQIMGLSVIDGHTVQDWLDIMHPDDRQRMRDYFVHEVVDLRGRFNKSYRIIRHNDKEVRWVHGLGELSYDASGNLLKMRGTIQDITEQKLAEDAIIEREQRYRAIFENNQAVMLIMDPESANIVDANESACTYYGYSYDQITSMKISDINIMSFEQVRNKLNQSATKEQSHFYFQHRLASGAIRDVEVYSGPIYISGKRFVYTIVHDITERREAEKKTIETSNLLKSILESSPEIIIFALDKEYRYRTFNARHKEVMKHLWGAEIEVGMSMLDVIGSNDSQIAKVNFDRVLAGESFVQSEEYDTDKLVQISWLNYWSPIRDGAGKISGITCFVLNVTEQKQAEAIKAQNVELSVANADKDRFISILAHDLRSPFNAILGYLHLLVGNLRNYDIDQIENHLVTINTSAKHAYKLLEDILMWARAQSGKLPFEPEKWNLGNICNEVVSELEFNAINKNIEINGSKLPQDLFVMADINMLKTVLRNLISNAIKFSYYGGKIDIYACQDEDKITISITDSGVGMSSIAISKLFDFTQNYTTLGTSNEKGTGLGLLLCKEFVDKHGGDIWAESIANQGSTFTFTLPAFKNPIFETFEDEAFDDLLHGGFSTNLNILVVDQDLMSQENAKLLFDRYCNTILFAKNGAEAIDLCSQNSNIDMVLVDMHQPDMTGYEVARQMRQINPKLIIFAQTAFAVAGVKEKALGAGCNDYLPKPFKQSVLADFMKRYFPST